MVLLVSATGLENNGQFRFTPPTHALLAFKAAMDEHKAEGGIPGRYARYATNRNSVFIQRLTVCGGLCARQ